MEVQIKSSVSRSAGFVLCGATGLIWLAQLTWSVGDLAANAQTGPYRNLLGLPGAVVSDILLHAFGLTAVLALVPLFFWGMTLISGAPVDYIRRKIVLWVVSTLSLAGALAAVPTFQSWPLRQGFGGVIGDLIYATAAGLLSLAHLPESAVLSGLAMMAGGLAAYFGALGAGRREIRMVLRAPRPRREPSLMVPAGFPAGGFGVEPSLPMTPAPAATGWSAHARAAMPAWMTPHGRRPAEHVPHHDPAPLDDHGMPPLEEFDPHEAASSRMMAERFAPPGAQAGSAPRRAAPSPVATPAMRPAAPQPQPTHAPPPEPRPARSGVKGMLSGLRGQRAAPAYRMPPLTFLKKATAQRPGPDLAQNVQRGVAKLLEDVLLDFGVKGKVQAIKPGPVVTLYETEPARGVKASRVIGLADDVARSMSATSARVALIPGRNVIGIELPNASRETVYLRELLEHESFKSATGALPLVLGRSISGDPVVADLARMPHLLVAGTTGSGKSVGINSMILSLIYRLGPEDCRFIMIDPKMLELSVYNGIPHLLSPVITDPQKAVSALNWVVREMEERYKRMAEMSVRSIDVYNQRVRRAAERGEKLTRTVQTGYDPESGQPTFERVDLAGEPMPYIVVVVDEMADLMLTAGKEIEGAVQRLAQMARAAGIHLIMATQRPSVDVVTGTIKANFPTRISFKVASRIDSRTILGDQGAEQLLGAGDMLFASGSGNVVRVHGPFVADDEVEQIAGYLRTLGEPAYVDGIADDPVPSDDHDELESEGSGDDLYDKAVAIVIRDRKASTSYLQRRLSIGYNRAADLMERMEADGIVSPANNVGKRDILILRDGVDHA